MMPISKTGIWINYAKTLDKTAINNRKSAQKTMRVSRHKKNGFTFFEVIIALAVVSIALVALLRLDLISINSANQCETMTYAAMLAQGKMAQVNAEGFPAIQSTHGQTLFRQLDLRWKIEVTNLQEAQLPKSDFSPLRRVCVTVNWQNGNSPQNYRLVTYAADRKIL